MDGQTQNFVRGRAQDRCEYCRIPQAVVISRFHVEHVIAKQHGGSDDESNLALACDRCNAFKGPNLSAIVRKRETSFPCFTRGKMSGPRTSDYKPE